MDYCRGYFRQKTCTWNGSLFVGALFFLVALPGNCFAQVDIRRHYPSAAFEASLAEVQTFDPSCLKDGAVTLVEGRVSQAPIMRYMEGFAKLAGVTGGLTKQNMIVSSILDTDPRQDQRPINGTLRWAVEAAREAGGGWISFDSNLGAQPQIDLKAPLRLPSNITIDGGCAGITLTAEPDDAIVLALAKTQNIVLTRLRFQKRGTTTPKSGGDCVTVGQGSDRLWVAFNSLRNCGDGTIDITQSRASDTPTRVTVAFNHFTDHDKTMIVGTLDCQQPGETGPAWCDHPWEKEWSWTTGVQVTLQGNVFAATGQRHPRLSGRAFVHMIDTVIASRPRPRSTGGEGASYGSYVESGGRLIVDSTLYAPLSRQKCFDAVRSPSHSCFISHERRALGAVSLTNVVVLGNGRAAAENEEKALRPPYALEPMLDFARNPEHTAKCAAQMVGPGGAFRTVEAPCQPRQ